MLNSFWSKDGQQGNKSQVETPHNPADSTLLSSDSIEFQTFRIRSFEIIEVVYKYVKNG